MLKLRSSLCNLCFFIFLEVNEECWCIVCCVMIKLRCLFHFIVFCERLFYIRSRLDYFLIAGYWSELGMSGLQQRHRGNKLLQRVRQCQYCTGFFAVRSSMMFHTMTQIKVEFVSISARENYDNLFTLSQLEQYKWELQMIRNEFSGQGLLTDLEDFCFILLKWFRTIMKNHWIILYVTRDVQEYPIYYTAILISERLKIATNLLHLR